MGDDDRIADGSERALQTSQPAQLAAEAALERYLAPVFAEARARTVEVHPTHRTAFAEAVAAAAPGDTLRLHPGNYRPVNLNKRLRIEGVPGVTGHDARLLLRGSDEFVIRAPVSLAGIYVGWELEPDEVSECFVLEADGVLEDVRFDPMAWLEVWSGSVRIEGVTAAMLGISDGAQVTIHDSRIGEIHADGDDTLVVVADTATSHLLGGQGATAIASAMTAFTSEPVLLDAERGGTVTLKDSDLAAPLVVAAIGPGSVVLVEDVRLVGLGDAGSLLVQSLGGASVSVAATHYGGGVGLRDKASSILVTGNRAGEPSDARQFIRQLEKRLPRIETDATPTKAIDLESGADLPFVLGFFPG